VARYSACKSGHGLNNQLVRALLAQQDCWESITYESPELAPAAYTRDWKLA
jgi:UDP-3-O-[3-hydroxymyristoyl] N-acetylglucosamine deacetylase